MAQKTFEGMLKDTLYLTEMYHLSYNQLFDHGKISIKQLVNNMMLPQESHSIYIVC